MRLRAQRAYDALSEGKIGFPYRAFSATPANYIMDSIFFDRGMLTLDCSYADFSICFIGTEDEISEAVNQSDRELAQLISECGLDDYDKLHILNRSDRDLSWDDDDENGAFAGDNAVEDVLRFMLKELEADNLIRCSCNENQLPQYDFKIVGSTVRYTATAAAAKIFRWVALSASARSSTSTR